MTLQDLTLAGLKKPTDLANPEDPAMVDLQRERLEQFPDRYAGYQQENGLIVAYIKTNEWLYGDEAPFIENAFSRQALRVASKLRGGSLNPKAYGVFGLVADESLERKAQNEIRGELLQYSIQQALAHSAMTLNIVIHGKDPLLTNARDLAFEPVGIRSEAAGAPGLIQQRYQRAL